MSAGAAAQCPPQLITSPDGSAADIFGWGMDATDRWLAIGDWKSDFFGGNRGVVHVFERIDVTGPWAPVERVFHPEVPVGHGFGWRVAIDGDSLMASAGGADGLPYGSGVVYEYRLRSGVWEFNERIDPPEPREGGGFGTTIALHGRTVAIADLVFPGTVWLFEDRGAGWELIVKIASPDPPTTVTDFGWSVALSDDWLMIGAPFDAESGSKSGALYAYERDASSGGVRLAQKLNHAGAEQFDFFGQRIGLDGPLLAVGTPGRSGPATTGDGAIAVFELEGAEWIQRESLQHEDPTLSGDTLGESVAVRGNVIVATAIGEVPPSLIGAGVIYAFERSKGRSWRQVARMEPLPGQWDNGRTVALSGSQAIVGSPRFSDGGSVTVHDLDCLTACRPDLDGDGELTLFDFLAFGNLFSAGDLRADFDDSGALDLFDFLAFQDAFAAGCA